MHKIERTLLIASSIWYFGEGMLGPLFAIFAERIGGDILDISWAWAAYLIFTGVFSVVLGRMSDRFSKERMMVAGYALNALFTFGYLAVDSPLSLLFIQIGIGLATAMATPTWDALYSKFEDKNRAGYTWGLADGGAHILAGTGILIGGAVASYFSFQVLFIVMGIIMSISTLYQARIFRFKNP